MEAGKILRGLAELWAVEENGEEKKKELEAVSASFGPILDLWRLHIHMTVCVR